jgi:3'-phosphoadenosine 5'-phosphosulfate sulfotransferase (PAPS reductase)/FAD synthetase
MDFRTILETLRRARWLVVNSSAGKDSQAMLDWLAELVALHGLPRDRVVVAHADLGRVEWPGTRELAEEQARFYGFRFEVVRRRTRDGRPQDLLGHVEARGKWPGSTTRFCTSDHKRGPIRTLLTRLVREAGTRHCTVVNCLGLRGEESPARAKRSPWQLDASASNSRRTVHTWLPIHDWTVGQVWERIKESGVRHHPAYDLGMPRLSCCFCIFSPRPALMLAGKHNPQLLDEYVRVERKTGHDFRVGLKLADVQAALARGEEPGQVRDWTM